MGLTSIQYFGSGLDGNNNNYSTLKAVFASCPLKWCEIINFLVQIHYDLGNPAALKPNIISLSAEYLAYLINNGYSINNENDNIRMALFLAVKYDQGFQMNASKLFDLNYYKK